MVYKIKENGPRRLGHVMGKEKSENVRMVMEMIVGRRGRLKSGRM